jgi:hypothetical protein
MTQQFIPDTHEVVVLLRNKTTGVESMLKLTEAFNVTVDIEREQDEPWFYPGEPYYARLMPPVTSVSLEITASGRNLLVVKDTDNIPEDEEDPNKWR